ncbi:putative RNA polymerase II subunit B1 CTD phosphatase RPAP2 isoform X2 [Dromiciops gliroides]|uniref:putative RNA polymerase II subunit B1 CTD phosphatase RPAP2 isoform X2 n=1 Tax=Dromiciops gliroides TaxID=33562 RepID=UPI001CC73B9B|nr:putative RNA polymerase II subunit B1 CTD phosphatase RPAP2 isoform X2 [Dromiciops gliroides]
MEDGLRLGARGGPRSRSSRAARKGASSKETSASKSEEASRRKAELEAAIRKKIEYERKALNIVEQLLEEDITEEFLVQSGKQITPAHYKDVVEERFITHLCGYPLCHNKLGNVPKQKYRISTKTNKVYDITERKFFCSNFCYRASKYFEAQISKSPLWVREEERPPDFQLLKEGQSGHSGEEVRLCDEAVKTSDIENPDRSRSQDESGSSSTHSHSSSEDEQEFVSSLLPGKKPNATPGRQQPYPKSILKKRPGQKANFRHQDKDPSVADVAERLNRCTLDSPEKTATCDLCLQEEKTCVSPDFSSEKSKASENSEDGCDSSQVTLVGISKKGAEHFRRKFAKLNQPAQSGSSPLQVEPGNARAGLFEALKETLVEWKTEETLTFLHGENYVPVPLTASPSTPQAEDEEKGKEAPVPGLGSQTAAVEWASQNTLDQSLPFSGSGAALHPLPSYESLKKETEALNLRIREFYRGKYVLDEQSPRAETRDKGDPTFPLIDSSSQNQIRRRIVLEKLTKVLPGILGPLQVTLSDIYTELKHLVQTFRLTNKNIIHKPAEWTLIAIVLLSLNADESISEVPLHIHQIGNMDRKGK